MPNNSTHRTLPDDNHPTSYSRSTTSQHSRRPLSVSDALAYLDAIKEEFHGQNEAYSAFLDVMKAFKSNRIDVMEVMMRISHLFRNRPSLIQGFNTFLPKGYYIQCMVDSSGECFTNVVVPPANPVNENEAPARRKQI